MAKILVVDDEIGIRELLSEILADEGHQVIEAENAGAARRHREAQRPDLVLLDIWMPDTDGITLLKEWAASGQLNMPVVMMSGHGTIETAVEATRIGALDYLEKPIALQRLIATVKRALRNQDAPPVAVLSLASIGRSAALVEVKKRLQQLAQSPAPLFLYAEAGMRADLFARLVCAPGVPFVVGDTIGSEPPADLLARAVGGVLFLPDLGRFGRSERRNAMFALERAASARVRVVSHAARDPKSLVAEHDFEPELASRLSELSLRLPALREFLEDVPDIAALMLAQLVEARSCPPRRLSTSALNALRHRPWLGNLAELEWAVKNMALSALDEELQLSDVERVFSTGAPSAPAPDLPLDGPYREARDAFEKLYFERLLEQEGGSMSRVAERSGLERTHLYRKLKALGVTLGRREDG